MENISQFISSVSFFLPYIGGVFGLIYLLLVFWVAKDIAQRSTSWIVQIFCIGISAFLPLFGVFFYLLLRPELLIHKEIREFLAHQK